MQYTLLNGLQKIVTTQRAAGLNHTEIESTVKGDWFDRHTELVESPSLKDKKLWQGVNPGIPQSIELASNRAIQGTPNRLFPKRPKDRQTPYF